VENINFSILDILLITGLVLLFVRVKGNGILKEMVFLSILLFYSYITLNNLEYVYDYFEDQGLTYADDIYNVFLFLFASAGLPFINFFAGLYVPKIKGILSIISGSLLAIMRFMLLIFLILQLFPNLLETSLVYNSFVINFLLYYFENIFTYLLI
jgi:hypothetical protein